jgi:predicted Zn-dependent protease
MRATALTILLALTLSAQDTPKKTGANFYSVDKESGLGADLSAQIRSRATVIDNAAVNDFVNRIGNRLAAQIPAAPFPYTFTVIAGDVNNSSIEPTAVPGGNIFIPAKLILQAQDEAEFAGMLAHSMIHISQRHYTRQMTRAELAKLQILPVIYQGGWAAYAAQQSSLANVELLKFERDSETEADKLGIAVTAAAGFDPSAFVRFIERVQAVPPGTDSKVFATLPTRQERVSSMEAAIQALPQRAYTAPDATGFAAIQAEVRGLVR